MTAKDKAIELVNKFYPNVQWKLGQEDCLDRAKRCALIAVDEVIKALEEHKWQNRHIIDEYEQLKKELDERI